MIKGITVNGKHSYYTFGLRMLKRSIGSPPKDDHTVRVPYSSKTYDFDTVMGASYGERTLSYRFEFMDLRRHMAEDKLVNIINWLHWSDRCGLYDDMLPDYHFDVREPTVTYEEKHGIYVFDVVFKASPEMVPNPNRQQYNASNTIIPDVDENGKINAADATAISAAYAAMSVGEDPGLTEAQLKAADADMNGMVNNADATLVLAFYSQASTGKYTGLTVEQAWAAFLNDMSGTGGEVY